jgi:hypothetical protein
MSVDLKELARINIERYSTRLAQYGRGVRGIRPHECEHYLALWQSIAYKLASGSDPFFSYDEQSEIDDALEDE